ncbi:Homeobox-leucine zipper protein HOX27 [Platanthera zijinensis]|uniref:Homeobox-leucine zipper protein HOX27 n=1 Tax=Platanthera zijinensis TaxID=2320716 RepID=A0AAP0BVH2_9ASPA
MELGLSLGEPPARASERFVGGGGRPSTRLKLGFCMEVGVGRERTEEEEEEDMLRERRGLNMEAKRRSADPPVQLNLLPLAPLSRQEMGFPWAPDNRNLEVSTRVLDVNQAPSADETAAMSSSPNSAVSSFHVDFAGGVGASAAAEQDRTSSRASDEEDNGGSRKKLRLSKDQSAFLEESFKEHNTLNPKQKLALAKQLNLRPRQVEVWFQNRRARTKLKQTEVDCEYLKRCCETLREENRRLQKELSDLRALKTSQPFYMQLPATTLSMCPSCERVSSNSTSSAATAGPANGSNPPAAADKPPSNFAGTLFPKPRFYPFAHQPSAAS